MFSREEKVKIASAVEDALHKVLREINHPEMDAPKGHYMFRFNVHIDGREPWSWADIHENREGTAPADPDNWNEKAREILK